MCPSCDVVADDSGVGFGTQQRDGARTARGWASMFPVIRMSVVPVSCTRLVLFVLEFCESVFPLMTVAPQPAARMIAAPLVPVATNELPEIVTPPIEL